MELWFSQKLLKWYRLNKRDLPWRHEKDPYKIWISEIILQQTQVAQGLAYYHRFINQYPLVKNLAAAKEDEVMKLWQGLGYYSRARNLHETAKIITKQYKGIFPSNFDQIKELKGIGDYTASAIASFAFDLPYAVLDGNVYRLLSRLFGIKTAIDTPAAKKEFTAIANSLLDKKRPAEHNQAIMEFGSQYCKPVNPNCSDCIFNAKCVAFNEGLVGDLPYKSKKIKVKKRYFNYFVLIDKHNEILIEKRTSKDIWQSLYQFPLIETNKVTSLETLLKSSQTKDLLLDKFAALNISKPYKHVLTHQLLYAQFYVFKRQSKHSSKLEKINIQNLTSLAFPRLIELFINDHNLEEIN